jgi:hypothetical protein
MPPMLPGQVRSAAIFDPIPEPFFEPTDATFKTQEIFGHQRERQASVLVLLAGHAGSSGLDQALGFRLGYVRDLGDLLRRSFQELRRRWGGAALTGEKTWSRPQDTPPSLRLPARGDWSPSRGRCHSHDITSSVPARSKLWMAQQFVREDTYTGSSRHYFLLTSHELCVEGLLPGCGSMPLRWVRRYG